MAMVEAFDAAGGPPGRDPRGGAGLQRGCGTSGLTLPQKPYSAGTRRSQNDAGRSGCGPYQSFSGLS